MARILVALGGNALSRRAGDGSWAEARHQMRRVAPTLARLAASGHELLLTHGNGPQVGRLLRQDEIAEREVPLLPIDVLGAESEGQIGYLIQQELSPALAKAGVDRPVLPIIGRIEVSPRDPAFKTPTKPVGRFYTEGEARLLRKRSGWTIAYDPQRGGWRRLLPSPRPLRWIEAPAVLDLLRSGWGRRVVPVIAGGGGVPVVRASGRRFEGVEAVIDKDRTAAVVGTALSASVLAIVTDVPHASLGFGRSWESAIHRTTPEALEIAMGAGEFAIGSMAPKIEAAIAFVRGGGNEAIITDIGSLPSALRGLRGTIVRPSKSLPSRRTRAARRSGRSRGRPKRGRGR